MTPNLLKGEKIRRSILVYTVSQVVNVIIFIILLKITLAFDTTTANTEKLAFRSPN